MTQTQTDTQSAATTAAAIPPGFMKNAAGRLVPENMIKPVDLARDALVRELIEKAQDLAGLVSAFKADAFADIAAFVGLSAEEYGIRLGGTKGNITLTSFDGRYRVVRHMQESLAFDERLQAAKQLIDQCIRRWTEGSRDEIRALINDAFQVNKEGLINTGRVLSLKRLNITDSEWQQAMQAISDSVQVASSKAYIRFYERIGDSDKYRQITTDGSSA